MKKMKKTVLSVLLFTFAFISAHDYAVSSKNLNIGYHLTYYECENNGIDLISNIHESIHNLLLEPSSKSINTVVISSYQKQFVLKNLFTSHVNPVLERPPLI